MVITIVVKGQAPAKAVLSGLTDLSGAPNLTEPLRSTHPQTHAGAIASRIGDGGVLPMARYTESDPEEPSYTDLRAAEPSRYEVGPDSWLAQAAAGVAAIRSKGARAVAPADDWADDWDPLTDPWPMHHPAGDGPTRLEQSIREEIDPLGLSYGATTWSIAEESTDLATTAEELTGFVEDVQAPAPVAEPEIVVRAAVRDPRREEQALIQTQPVELGEHPSGPLPRAGVWPPTGGVPESPAALAALDAPVARRYDVTLMGPLGAPEFGFGGGQWYSLAGENAREVAVAEAISAHPDKAGQIVQLACWWLREQPQTARALDLATELAMAVSELARRELAREPRSA